MKGGESSASSLDMTIPRLASYLGQTIDMSTLAKLNSVGITSLGDMVTYRSDNTWAFTDYVTRKFPNLIAGKVPSDIRDLCPVSLLRTGTCWSTNQTTLPYPDGVFEILGCAPNNDIIVRIWSKSNAIPKGKRPSTNLALRPDSFALGSSTLLSYPYEVLFPNQHCARIILSADILTKSGVERSILATNPHMRPLVNSESNAKIGGSPPNEWQKIISKIPKSALRNCTIYTDGSWKRQPAIYDCIFQ